MRKTSGKNIGKSCCKKIFGSDVFRKIPDMENASGTNISSGCCSLQIPDEDGSGVFLLSAGVVDGGILGAGTDIFESFLSAEWMFRAVIGVIEYAPGIVQEVAS